VQGVTDRQLFAPDQGTVQFLRLPPGVPGNMLPPALVYDTCTLVLCIRLFCEAVSSTDF